MEIGNIIAIVAAAIVGYGVVTKLLSKSKDAKLQELDKNRAKEEGKLEVLQAEQPGLRKEAEAEQGGVSEDKKTEFWEEYLAEKDPNKPTDSQ